LSTDLVEHVSRVPLSPSAPLITSGMAAYFLKRFHTACPEAVSGIFIAGAPTPWNKARAFGSIMPSAFSWKPDYPIAFLTHNDVDRPLTWRRLMRDFGTNVEMYGLENLMDFVPWGQRPHMDYHDCFYTEKGWARLEAWMKYKGLGWEDEELTREDRVAAKKYGLCLVSLHQGLPLMNTPTGRHF
jgi:hypothetical protein